MTKADQKRLREQRDADWRWLIGHKQGRRLLAEMIAASGLLSPLSNDNPIRMAYLEGRRSLGADIYAALTRLAESAEMPALLAEVLMPLDVRNSSSSADRDDASSDD